MAVSKKDLVRTASKKKIEKSSNNANVYYHHQLTFLWEGNAAIFYNDDNKRYSQRKSRRQRITFSKGLVLLFPNTPPHMIERKGDALK